jgi:hypothetical protein
MSGFVLVYAGLQLGAVRSTYSFVSKYFQHHITALFFLHPLFIGGQSFRRLVHLMIPTWKTEASGSARGMTLRTLARLTELGENPDQPEAMKSGLRMAVCGVGTADRFYLADAWYQCRYPIPINNCLNGLSP